MFCRESLLPVVETATRVEDGTPVVFGEIWPWYVDEGLVEGDNETIAVGSSELDDPGVNGDELAALLDEREAAGTEDGVAGLVRPGVDGARALAADEDKLDAFVVKGDNVSVGVVDVYGVREDPDTARDDELNEPAIAAVEDEEGIGEGTRVGVDIVEVVMVGVEDGIEDGMNEEREGNVVAASEGVLEVELGVDVKVEVGEVEGDGEVEIVCSLAVEEIPFPNGAWIEGALDVVGAVEDVGTLDDASAVEDVHSQAGVTGMTVNRPSSSSSSSSPPPPPSFRRAVGVSDTVGAVDDMILAAVGRLDDAASWPGVSERVIGLAKHDQAMAKRAAK